jgi:hypothetical protein
MNDMWLYNTSSGLWTFLGGDTVSKSEGVYNVKGVADATTWPAARYGGVSWKYKGKLWLFGGLLVFPTYSNKEILVFFLE